MASSYKERKLKNFIILQLKEAIRSPEKRHTTESFKYALKTPLP